jgi:hypothetical protein
VDVLKNQVKDSKQTAREKLEEAKKATNSSCSEELSAHLKEVQFYFILQKSRIISSCKNQ